MVFVGNPTRQRKSKEPFQLRLLFEWFLKEILLDHAIQFWLVLEWFLKELQPDRENPSNLSNFDPFLNGFCMKSY